MFTTGKTVFGLYWAVSWNLNENVFDGRINWGGVLKNF